MSKPFRSSIGLILLISTVLVASCQSMVQVINPANEIADYKKIE